MKKNLIETIWIKVNINEDCEQNLLHIFITYHTLTLTM